MTRLCAGIIDLVKPLSVFPIGSLIRITNMLMWVSPRVGEFWCVTRTTAESNFGHSYTFTILYTQGKLYGVWL
jgi:hypothetical protein